MSQWGRGGTDAKNLKLNDIIDGIMDIIETTFTMIITTVSYLRWLSFISFIKHSGPIIYQSYVSSSSTKIPWKGDILYDSRIYMSYDTMNVM